MRIVDWKQARTVNRLIVRDAARDPRVQRGAARIVADVRRRGDRAILEWTRQLDDRDATRTFELTRREIDKGWADTPAEVRAAIREAARNIRRVAEGGLPRARSITVRPGVRVESRVEPLARAGCYVPGGRYPLPSTLLMTVIPASAAGVRDITVACAHPSAAVLCAAREAGAIRVLRIGGAQAIAAMAYGTESIARVDKIAGPGNAWVSAAKALVAADCAIDFHAGPSELVVCSNRGRPDVIAADLIAQAEHDPYARVMVVTTSRELALQIGREVQRQLPDVPRARAAIRRGGIIVAPHERAAIDIVNRIAPEHLVCDRASDAVKFRTAGTIFVGTWSAPAVGDYTTGSNHVLPTGGAARFRGGLTPADFVRVFTVQTLTGRGLARVGPAAMSLAAAEGLTGHARSLRIRL